MPDTPDAPPVRRSPPVASARVALPLLVADEIDAPAATAPSAPATTDPLAAQLARRAVPGALYERLPSGALKCTACAHRCVMDEGRTGACGVRFARDGSLRVPFDYVARRYVRAVETNTIYHVRPGARALTFGMYGCDLRCPYCHNWRISQALREEPSPTAHDAHDAPDDRAAAPSAEAPTDITARALVDEAEAAGCRVVCAAYNEPMIAAEWARAVFAEARARGMLTAAISDGNTTPEALAYMRPVLDVFRVDLKGYSREQYKALGGRLAPVLDAIREARRLGYWVEVVTLVVPGFNDSPDGLRAIARALAEIDPNIPWHLNAFYPRYKLADRPRTDGLLLTMAAGTAYARGLRHVYVSNLADEVRELSHTRCPRCHTTLIERDNYATTRDALGPSGRCPSCSEPIAGLWA